MATYTERACSVHGLTKFVLERRGYYRCAACRSRNVTRCRQNRKIKLVKLKGGRCELCGYDRCVAALEFHHLDPSTKEFEIAHKGITRSWKKMSDEAAKCALLCANCHREVEAGIATLKR